MPKDQFPARPIHILVVDDELVDRMLVVRNFRKSDLQGVVTEASNVEEAREWVRQKTFDAIFLDYRLPKGTCTSFLRELRENEYYRPVIVVTSQADTAVAVEVLKAGGTDFLAKDDLSPDRLAQVLRSGLRVYEAEELNRQTTLALQKSEARLAEAQKIAGLGHWELNLKTGRIDVSQQAYRILGYTEDQPGPKSIAELLQRHIHPEDYPKAEKALIHCKESGNDVVLDVRIHTLPGDLRDVELHFRPQSLYNHILSVQGTLLDITARKQVERELKVARDAAERNARMKEEFLANMSHEIRTPMNAILGFARLLRDTPLSPDQQDYLSAVDLAGNSLLAIINDILDLSKIEAGGLRFESVNFDLEGLLKALVKVFGEKAREKGLELGYDLGPGVPKGLQGDQVRLNQVLLNLVGNALKFTESGSVSVEVREVETEGDRIHLLFEVVDSGIGIEKEQQQTIFDSFTQARSDTTRKYGGTGLGLTICKRIVELQGGRIGVVSTPGEGSTFFFDLWFDRAVSNAIAPGPIQPAASETLPAMHILLVEDQPLNQKLALQLLARMGHTATLANNGREALERLEHQDFDLALVDIQMPEMDGYALTHHLRHSEREAWRSLPIIALTAHAFQEERDRCREAGMQGFVTKPFTPEALQMEMAQVMGLPVTEMATPAAGLGRVRDLAQGNPDFEREMVALFRTEAPAGMARLREALGDRDMGAFRATLHSLRPSFELFEVPESAGIFRLMREMSLENRPSADIAPQLEQLEMLLNGALDILPDPR